MYTALIITGGLEIFSFAVSVVLIFAILLRRQEKFTGVFLSLVILNMCGIACNITPAFLEGLEGPVVHYTLKTLDFLDQSFSFLVFLAFLESFWKYISQRNESIKSKTFAVWCARIITLCAIIYAGLSEIFDIYSFYNAENFYQSTELYWTGLIFPTLCALIDFSLTLRYRDCFNRRERVSFFVMLFIIPLAAVISQLIAPDLPTIYIFSNIMVMIMFVNIYLENEKKIKEQELRLS